MGPFWGGIFQNITRVPLVACNVFTCLRFNKLRRLFLATRNSKARAEQVNCSRWKAQKESATERPIELHLQRQSHPRNHTDVSWRSRPSSSIIWHMLHSFRRDSAGDAVGCAFHARVCMSSQWHVLSQPVLEIVVLRAKSACMTLTAHSLRRQRLRHQSFARGCYAAVVTMARLAAICIAMAMERRLGTIGALQAEPSWHAHCHPLP